MKLNVIVHRTYSHTPARPVLNTSTCVIILRTHLTFISQRHDPKLTSCKDICMYQEICLDYFKLNVNALNVKNCVNLNCMLVPWNTCDGNYCDAL